MGSSISTAMDKNRQDMKAMQLQMQNRMRKVQMATQVAMMRDRTIWMGSAYASGLAGLLLLKARGKPVPAAAGVPLFIGGWLLAYNYDMAWGTKLDRIDADYQQLIRSDRWFGLTAAEIGNAEEKDSAGDDK